MAADTLPDLNQIQLSEAFFIECLIGNNAQGPVALPSDVAGYERPQVRLFPMVNLVQNVVSFDVRVQATALDVHGQPLPITGKFRLLLSFAVANLPDLLFFNEKFKQNVPNSNLTLSLVGVAYSTARGMIMSKVNDTVMGGFALPLKSALQLMEESQPTTEEVMAARAHVAAAAASKPKKKRAATKPKE